MMDFEDFVLQWIGFKTLMPGHGMSAVDPLTSENSVTCALQFVTSSVLLAFGGIIL